MAPEGEKKQSSCEQKSAPLFVFQPKEFMATPIASRLQAFELRGEIFFIKHHKGQVAKKLVKTSRIVRPFELLMNSSSFNVEPVVLDVQSCNPRFSGKVKEQ